MKIAASVTLAALIAAAGALVLGLPAQAKPEGQCIRMSDIRNHTVGDDHTLYLDVNGRSVYRVSTGNACLAGATSSDPIVLHSWTSSPYICHPIELDLGVRETRCIVSSLTKLTPEEVAALPKKMKP